MFTMLAVNDIEFKHTLVNIEMTTGDCTIIRHRIIILRPCFYLLVSGFGNNIRGEKMARIKAFCIF